MKRLKPLISISLLLLVTTMINSVNANSWDQNYVYSLAGFEVCVEYPSETCPNQTITVNVTVKAWTKLIVNRTEVELHTFNNLTREDELFYNIEYVSKPESLLGGDSLNETSYEIKIPDYATNVLYGKLILRWTVEGTEESTTYEREPTFIMTYLRNLELERLRSKVVELEKENAELNGNIADLNNTINDLDNTITDLNSTLTELLNNLTDVEKRYEGELSGTRSVVTILAITTIFFVATTAYLFLRKPKQYW